MVPGMISLGSVWELSLNEVLKVLKFTAALARSQGFWGLSDGLVWVWYPNLRTGFHSDQMLNVIDVTVLWWKLQLEV